MVSTVIGISFGIIILNPAYVDSKKKDRLPKGNRSHDPSVIQCSWFNRWPLHRVPSSRQHFDNPPRPKPAPQHAAVEWLAK